MLVLLLLVRVERGRGRGRGRSEVVVGLVGGAMICLGMFGSEVTGLDFVQLGGLVRYDVLVLV